MTKSYNKYNFHNHTFCIWNEVDFDKIKELKINYKSKSGSSYIFTEIGVYRINFQLFNFNKINFIPNTKSMIVKIIFIVGFCHLEKYKLILNYF